MNWYLAVLKNYTGFSGRARRMEYWMFVLVNSIIYLILSLPPAITGEPGWWAPYTIYGLAVIIPSLAVAVRRLHDTDRSGWWILIGLVPLVGGIILLVFLVLDSQPGPNKYGPNPKGVQAYGQGQYGQPASAYGKEPPQYGGSQENQQR